MEHHLHRVVGDALLEIAEESAGMEVLLDPACGAPNTGCHNLPLFLSSKKSNATEVCNVDAVVFVDGAVKVVVEIEEADVGPTQICGKLLTTALAEGLIHETCGKELVPLADDAVFVQVLDTAGLNRTRSAKVGDSGQWRNLEAAITDILPLKGKKVTTYKLLYGGVLDFQHGGEGRKKLDQVLRAALRE
ncbi:MAG: hypothetical protein HY907_09590 [Deltaproteobacteria bacterium]|nr:hypothetical protein [Deltaproteobacteria bacterium]